ncbi:uncharacterized protein LOC142326621 isoform X2 [Lycorma delicatula]|uniref:uncharacterized protein LOC142326621 isoform X2 n=1 Tax=Lycorma delicatula TaxID=130591 RepID=UPI003F50E035
MAGWVPENSNLNTKYNKELDDVQSYHEPEYHRGYYRGRGRGRYQSVVRKAIGRIGPPGGGSAEGPPSYYNTDSYTANRHFLISFIPSILLFLLLSLSSSSSSQTPQIWCETSIVSLVLLLLLICSINTLKSYNCYAFIVIHDSNFLENKIYFSIPIYF